MNSKLTGINLVDQVVEHLSLSENDWRNSLIVHNPQFPLNILGKSAAASRVAVSTRNQNASGSINYSHSGYTSDFDLLFPLKQNTTLIDAAEVHQEITKWLQFDSEDVNKSKNLPPQLYVFGTWNLEIPMGKFHGACSLEVDINGIYVYLNGRKLKVEVAERYPASIIEYLHSSQEEIHPATLRAVELLQALDSLKGILGLAQRLKSIERIVNGTSIDSNH